MRLGLGLIAALAVPVVATAPPDAPPVVALSTLEGAVVPERFVLTIDLAGATSAKLVVDGTYAGEDDEPPLQFAIDLSAGEHRAVVRAIVDAPDDPDTEARVDSRFTVSADAPTPIEPPSPVSTAATTNAAGELVVTTPDQLREALTTAVAGEVIRLADGEYRFDQRLEASASGTAAAPITLVGSRAAVIRTKNASGDYGLHITGDHWRIEGITVAHATKGIVLDGSVGTVIDGVEVFDIGDEGVHFRSCSSDGTLTNSFIHDTGRNSPQYGEGVYVGSANSNWHEFACTDDVEGVGEGDNTERTVIEGNVFEDITAEGADLKEGTDSGILRANTFRRVGASGMNSADSAVDVKGNGWPSRATSSSETDAPWDDDGEARPSEFADGFQTHRCTTATARPTRSAATSSTAPSPASASASTRPWATPSRATTRHRARRWGSSATTASGRPV